MVVGISCRPRAQDGAVHMRDRPRPTRSPRAGPGWPAWSPGWPGSASPGWRPGSPRRRGSPGHRGRRADHRAAAGAAWSTSARRRSGFADKPMLLAMIVAAVLVLCGLAGRLECRRRFGGAAVFAGVAVLGLIGVSAQPGAALTAYLPTVVGLLFGYLILRTLITGCGVAARRAADAPRPTPRPGVASWAGPWSSAPRPRSRRSAGSCWPAPRRRSTPPETGSGCRRRPSPRRPYRPGPTWASPT